MQYLCLVHGDDAEFATLPAETQTALDEASLAADEELRRTGNLIVASALEPASSAVIVRVRDGRMSATTGPFAETAEQVGGFVLIQARDLNDAVRIAGQMPVANHATIEVRPVLDLPRRARERRAALDGQGTWR
jgi:hypothetical protein